MNVLGDNLLASTRYIYVSEVDRPCMVMIMVFLTLEVVKRIKNVTRTDDVAYNVLQER